MGVAAADFYRLENPYVSKLKSLKWWRKW